MIRRQKQVSTATRLAVLGLAAFSVIGFAQEKPDVLEPLPADPKQRIFYGEYYNPERYAKCREDRAKKNDPGGVACERYRERLEPLDPNRRDTFGEFYDPKAYHECRSQVERRDTQCEYLKVRRQEPQELWPYANVPAVKWPEAPDPPVYRWWMSSARYFEALCKSEAGEFISRTIDGVEGVYEIRGRRTASWAAIHDRYVMEDPYGYTEAQAQTPATIFVGPKKYRFYEGTVGAAYRPQPEKTFIRMFGYDNRDPKSMKREFDSKLKSRYGFTWRGIRRPKDREHGIAGGELIVVDLQTNEILGVRRGFMLAGKSQLGRSEVTWEHGRFCPILSKRTGMAKDFDATYQFVARILVPAKQ